MHVATDMVPNTPRRGMRGWAVRSLCITQIKSYHPNEPLRRKVPEMNTFPQFHFCRVLKKCTDWGAGTWGTPFSYSGGPVLKTSIVNFVRPTQLYPQICATFRYSMAGC